MLSRIFAAILALSALPALARSPEHPTVVVHGFSVSSGVPWPYDMKQLATEAVAELQRKNAKQFELLSEAPATLRNVFSLDGEILEWHPGNRATRILVGMGSGRETAKIHYWLSDETGKRVFDHTDTIRAAFWGNEYAASVGQLALPFADKIAARLSHAKLE